MIGIGDVVTLYVSDCPDRVCGTVENVYTDAIGSTVAEGRLSDGTPFLQNVVCLTPYVPSTPWWVLWLNRTAVAS